MLRMMPRTGRRACALGASAVLAASACALPVDSGRESEETLLEPLVAFQEGDVVQGIIVYTNCTNMVERPGWLMDRLPAADPVLVDLYYVRQSPPDHLFPHLWQEDVEKARGAGAQIVHEFNMGVVRALVPRQSLPRLAPHTARLVPRGDRFDVTVHVGYAAGASEPLMQAFRDRGGVITDHYQRIGAFRGVVPDAAIPELRALDGTVYVIHGGMPACLL